MKDTIVNLIVVAALSFSGTVLSAEEAGGKAQPAAAPPVASAVPTATVVESTPPATAKEPQPATRTTSRKHTRAKAVRPKDLDLRHCLELDNNPAIARCAHE